MSRTKRRKRSQKRQKPLGRRLFWMVAIILLLIVLYKGARIGIAAQQAYRNLNNLQEVAQTSLANGDINSVQLAVFNASQSLNGLDNQIGPLSPILRSLSGITAYGTTLANLPELLAVGNEYLGIADQGIAIAGPSLVGNAEQPLLVRLANVASSSETDLVALAERANAAKSGLANLPLSEMVPAVSSRLEEVQSFSELLGPLLKLAPIFPQLAGMDESRTYLLLIQNNHELRATGGFITAVGTLYIDKGDIAELNFSDSYEIANNNVDHPWAPEAMQRYLGVELMFLRDVNWSPDFPTTAQLARTIYGLDEGVYVDGVISVDLHAVQTLMGGLGRIRLQGIDQPIGQDNIIDQLKLFWQEGSAGQDDTQAKEAVGLSQWWRQRKDFMPLLGEAAITRIKDGDVDYVQLATAVQEALEKRSIQIWLNDPTAAEHLSNLGWDGGIRARLDHDYLALVDSNFGYNKVDSVIERQIQYNVSWPTGSNESATAQTQITYKHGGKVPEAHTCDITPRYGSTYDDMAARCYFNYVRLYVPQGSKLIDISGVNFETISSQAGEGNTQVFAAYFTMHPGTEHTVTFQYELPIPITPEDYKIQVRRQSGTDPIALNLNVANRSGSYLIEQSEFTWQ